ncbi:hypothetical protein [Marinilabilia salmonicolor]|uniref:hypothetical protein n=1 Tax=Marinilabilia salmonicolor TaxID=989 RepID=UPI000299E401|nr:hypothetical protein [Marinilabilia salmonicolor]
MAKRFKARPYKTVNGHLYILSNMPILKPSKVDKIMIVPDAVMDALNENSYKYIYDDAFIELFKDMPTFKDVKQVIEKLEKGVLEEQSSVEIDNWTKYPLGTSGTKIRSYLYDFLPADYSVIFKNDSSIVVKDLVLQRSKSPKGYTSFVKTDGEECFKFPNASIKSIERFSKK